MPQSRPLSVGLDVHTDAIAVAYVATDHAAQVLSCGTIGTRHAASDQRTRQLPAQAQRLVFVSDAGPCGSWLYRYRHPKGYACGGGAPSLMPTKAGDLVQTDRRDAMQLAWRMRAGDRTAGDVPTVDDEAIRDLGRAREEAIQDLQAAP